ncbi:MAG TPA: tetratricopeptide repeat protein [Terriglobales bacterium]|nr:tetratricopeptide repeat protein [Terriglobales bacterium]
MLSLRQKTPTCARPDATITPSMDRKRSYFVPVACLCLALATLAVYSRAVRNPFLHVDDQNYVTENPHVQAGLTWQTFTWAWTATAAQNWHPLTWLSHALDCQLYGLNPVGHHSTNIVLHALNVVLLFLLLLRVTGAKGRSLLVAALFAVHPLNVESVAWIAERKNLLSTLFFLLTLAAYGWYARRPDVKRFLSVAVLFAFGLAAKPMVITLPFVLLLLDFWPLQRIRGWDQPSSSTLKGGKNRKAQSQGSASEKVFPVPQFPWSRVVLEKLPLLALSLGSAAITIIAQRAQAIQSFEIYPFGGRLENAIYSYAAYVWKAFWPMRLAFLYPYPRDGRAVWQPGLAILFLVTASAFVWKLRRSRPYLATGWLWYLGTLVPVIGLIQVGDQAMADRYAYLPLIGIFVMIVWSAADAADRRRVNSQVLTAIAVVGVAALSFLTWRQIAYWRSDYDLWSHTVKVTKHNVVADESLSKALMQLGRPQEAVAGFAEAASLNPGDPFRHVNLAAALVESDRLTDAISEYESTIKATADPAIQARCYESIATIYDQLGDYAKVRENYQLALQADPTQAPGMVERISRDAAGAPSAPRYLQLGILLQELGKLPEARIAYQQALGLDPKLAEAKESLDALKR